MIDRHSCGTLETDREGCDIENTQECIMAISRLKPRDHEAKARLLEEGQQDIREGRYIADADLDAWLDGLDDDPDLAIPLAGSLNPIHPR
jgi:hypothetical protein